MVNRAEHVALSSTDPTAVLVVDGDTMCVLEIEDHAAGLRLVVAQGAL